jgi:Tol biopolymer transport system component
MEFAAAFAWNRSDQRIPPRGIAMLSQRPFAAAVVALLTVLAPFNSIAAEPPKILFAANFVENLDEDKGKEIFKIFAMNEDRSNLSRITKGDETSEFDAVYSPDGKRIAFAAVTQKKEHGILPVTAIFVMNSDGSERKQLTKGAPMTVTPAWSPDGKRIVYGTVGPIDEKPRKTNIFVMDANGENAKALDEGAFPAWSPDGKHIAFARMDKDLGTLHIRPVDGGEPKELGKSRVGVMAAFSPDGKRIAYVGPPPEKDEGLKFPGPQIYVMNADGSDPKQVTKAEIGALGARWSADGKRLFFCQLGIGPRGMADLMVVDTDGKNQKRLIRIAELNILPGISLFAHNLGIGSLE